jgi:asparagine synthase (glutamine-hydrolysing)
MCGLCGILYVDESRLVEPSLVKQMTDSIIHRGPDDEGHFISGHVGLGSRRLSIVGLSDGHMPMSTADGNLTVAYNGELYNYPQIKEQLTAKGYTFRTHSDTESFLHLYQEYGDRFLEHTQGMFGMALWDQPTRRLILARDRLGIKPLYYHFDGKALRFGSEIKTILCDQDVSREIDLDALNLYLSYLATPSPFTMFKGIRHLQPGEMLIYQNGTIKVKPFWQPQDEIQTNYAITQKDAVQQLRERLSQTVQEHLLADVPVGAFLSGGIDSSVLVGLMKEHIGSGFQTFAIGFEGHDLFDETGDARRVANHFGTEHFEQKLSPSDLLGALGDITKQLDEPLADSSCLPVYYVSKLAAEHGKVVLSGDGGDEIFAGYRKYLGEHYRRYVSWMPRPVLSTLTHTVESFIPESRSNFVMDYLRQVKKFFRGVDPDAFSRHRRWALHYEDSLRQSFLHCDVLQQINLDESTIYRKKFYDEMPQLDELSRMLWVDLRHGLPADMLTKVDRMSMLHSLEVRVPFLDHKLVEWAFSLPGNVKLNGTTTKWILKEAFKDMLPDDILHKRKHGFDVPVGEWFKHELRDVIGDVCSTETVTKRGLFNPHAVQSLLNDHTTGKRDYNNQLWILLSLELWQREYVDSV